MDFRKNPLVLLMAALLFAVAAPAAPIKSEYRIRQPGLSVPFEVATDEIQVSGQRQPETIPPQANAEAVRVHAEKVSRDRGTEAELVLYPKGSHRSEHNRRILTKD